MVIKSEKSVLLVLVITLFICFGAKAVDNMSNEKLRTAEENSIHRINIFSEIDADKNGILNKKEFLSYKWG